MLERLQKILAHSGVASRRKCEEIIAAGRVTVNGRTVTEMGTKADPEKDSITVDGKTIRAERYVYLLLNKPSGYLCTTDDPFGRRTVMDLIESVRERVFPVGRLDEDTEGLVIMTNDGALANTLTHPRYGARKTYSARVRGKVTDEAVEELKRGIYLPDGKAVADEVEVHGRRENESNVTLVMREGRNHVVKKMLARVGFPVKKLKRTRIEFLTLHRLSRGAYRPLTRKEVALLGALAERRREKAPPAGARRARQRRGGKKRFSFHNRRGGR